MKNIKKHLLAVALAAVAFGGSALATTPDFITYDGSTGAVSFAPATAISPVITAVVAAVTAGIALFVISLGVRWVYRMLRRS